MSPRRYVLRSLALGLLVLCAAGCINEKTAGNATVYTFAPWVGAIVTLVGLLALPIGWLIRGRSARFGWGLILLAPIVLGIIAPGMWLDRLEVDNNHFALRTGFWFAPTQHDLRFDDLTRIAITAETRATRRGTRTSYYLDCYKKSGGMEHVPVGTLMKEGIDKILDVADDRGVAISDNTGGK